MAEQADTRTPAGKGRAKGHRWFAALYDSLNRGFERRFLGRLRARLLHDLTGKVLEIGVGTGVNLPYYPSAADVVGIEPDPFMLRRAREKLAGAARPMTEFRQGAAEALPFEDGSFDHVVSTLVLCTVADPSRALSEIRRVLNADGRLHFIEHVRADGWLGRIQDLIRPAWRYVGAGCNPNRPTRQLIEEAGFRLEQLETRTMQFGIPILIGTARPG